MTRTGCQTRLRAQPFWMKAAMTGGGGGEPARPARLGRGGGGPTSGPPSSSGGSAPGRQRSAPSQRADGRRWGRLSRPPVRADRRHGLAGSESTVNAGVPERVAMKVTGNRTRALVDRYHIVSPADLQDVARRLDGHVRGGVLDGRPVSV